MSNTLANQLARQTSDAIKFAGGGSTITLRRVARGTGATPYANPPSVEGATIAVAAGAGATTIAIAAEAASGQLLSGDQIIVNGLALTVGAPAPASAVYGQQVGFPSVSLQSPIPIALAAGVAISFAFSADQPIYAAIRAYPVSLVAGSGIQVGDLMVTIAAYNLGAAPQDTDLILFNGSTLEIVTITPFFVYGQAVKYQIQARTA